MEWSQITGEHGCPAKKSCGHWGAIRSVQAGEGGYNQGMNGKV